MEDTYKRSIANITRSCVTVILRTLKGECTIYYLRERKVRIFYS